MLAACSEAEWFGDTWPEIYGPLKEFALKHIKDIEKDKITRDFSGTHTHKRYLKR